jgi:hypothetical protein
MRIRLNSDVVVLLAIPVLMLLVVLPVGAQTPETPVSWTAEFFAAGVNTTTGAPVSTYAFTVAQATCNLDAVAAPTPPIVNPTKLRFSDPGSAGKDCEVTQAALGTVLLALPVGVGYTATLKAHGATQVSGRSAASVPFSRAAQAAPPAVPVGVRMTR